MILFKRAAELTSWLQNQRSEGKKIGFVPTMGALHSGHISLIDISQTHTDITVCSIFVNPTQFNDPKDFQKYPITIEKDIYLLEKAGTGVLFLPEVDELYPEGTKNLETYALGNLETLLEGKYRPGHFQGVCQVVRRLLDLVRPDQLFMGQKDYQQCMVIQRLIDLQGYQVALHPCPIIREADGLAMSSRNMRLTEEQRKKAPAISKALTWLKEQAAPEDRAAPDDQKSLETMISKARSILEENDFRVDYIEIADAVTLEPLPALNGKKKRVALAAAFLGEVRLIDNMII
ncbi:pantoate--beta-alanine ligase [Flavitalea flava]